MKTTFIYALCEPETKTIRYIGKTDSLEKRLKEHVSISPRYNSHLGHWMTRVVNSGKQPNIILLKEVPESEWEEWERCYIRNARMLGFHLVNGTDGGEGITFSSEIRKKISDALTGKKISIETRKKQSLAKRGKKHPAHLREKRSLRQLGRKEQNSSSRYNGVYWAEHANCWRSEFCFRKIKCHVGYFLSEIDAAISWDWVAKLYCGKEFPRFNFPE